MNGGEGGGVVRTFRHIHTIYHVLHINQPNEIPLPNRYAVLVDYV